MSPGDRAGARLASAPMQLVALRDAVSAPGMDPFQGSAQSNAHPLTCGLG